MEGMPGAVPPEVAETYNNCKTPKDRAAVINQFVPKDTNYADMPDFSNKTMTHFRHSFKKDQVEKMCKGITYSDLVNEYGRGDVGVAAVDMAVQRGDVIVKNGFYFRRSLNLSQVTCRHEEHEAQGTCSVEDKYRLIILLMLATHLIMFIFLKQNLFLVCILKGQSLNTEYT